MTPKGLALSKIRQLKLIGVVTAFRPYFDVAINKQTRRLRILSKRTLV
jgi:hypothetical protein